MNRVEVAASRDGGKRSYPGRKVGRLVIHENPNHRGFWAVSHGATGGQIARARDEADAERIAAICEAEHSEGLDLLDLLDWGQQLPDNIRKHPAIKRMKEFRERTEQSA